MILYTTQRKTNRWPMVIFFHLLDIGGINAYYKLWLIKNPDWKKNRLERRMFLLELEQQLFRINIIRRYNDKTLHAHIKQSMLTVLPELKEISAEPVPATSSAQKRRFSCAEIKIGNLENFVFGVINMCAQNIQKVSPFAISVTFKFSYINIVKIS